MLSATDADSATKLAWYGAAAAVLLLTVALFAAWPSGIQIALVPLAGLLLLRHDERLLLAPVYGACLLMIDELGQRSIELRGQAWIGSGVIGSRLLIVTVVACLGGCAAALGAIAVTIAPARSVGFTAVGTVALLAAVVCITLLARPRGQGQARRTPVGDEPQVGQGPEP